MINPAVLAVPAMVASQTIRRQQQTSDRARISYPSIDRDAFKESIWRYVSELQEEGFEVCIEDDVVHDRIIIRVRKGKIEYCESVSWVEFEQTVYADYILRKLVRNVENAFNDAEKLPYSELITGHVDKNA